MTEFRLLGSLDVRVDGRSVALGGKRQRAVLAVLLLHNREVVSVDALFDAVWGERVPKTAAASLQNCISRLRHVLSYDVIETRSPGYALRAEPDAIDAVRFERLVGGAAGKPAPERFALLTDAIALWHGAALADFLFEDFAQPFIRRLNTLRLEAIEGRIEAQLELGRHAEVIAEIDALAQAHPSHERLRHLQMLALYRTGRQVDALGVFQETRLALADDLGLEPSEELRALERMILDHDPALDAATAEDGSPAAPAPLGREERRTVTILRGMPVASDDADPEAGREAAAAWLALASTIVQAHGGGLGRLAGAELSAMFGLAAAREDDALRAVRAAHAIREQCGSLGTDWHCRIETCELVTSDGAVEDGGGTDGATVNEILLDPATLRLVAGAVEAVPAAGGADYRLLGLIQGAPSVRRRFDAVLVGRERELDRIEAAAEAAWREDGPRSVLVVGEPGIGKTRLAVSLAERLRSRALTLTGRCVPYGEGPAYLSLLEIVTEAVGPGGDLRRKVERRLRGEAEAGHIAGCLAELAASEAPKSAHLLWAVRRFLEVVARDRPLLVVLDDIQWADPGLLDLVEYLGGWCEGRVALVGLARPELLEQRPGWAAGTIELGPLTDSAAQALFDGLPESREIAPDVATTILQTAEGNPLFLEQIAAMTADGALLPGAVPATLEALLASRLDALPVDERDVLARAAVAGREFSRSDVEALSPDTELTAIGSALMALARRRLVRPDRMTTPGEDGFRFEHILIRNAAYAAIPDGRRADLHERLAHWLDARADSSPEVVGFHFEAAALATTDTGRRERLGHEAATRLGEAGHQAILRIDNGVAARLLDRAVALLPSDDPLRYALEIDLGYCLKNQGDLSESVAILESVERNAAEQGDVSLRLRASVELAWPRLMAGHVSVSALLALVDEAEPIFVAAGDYYAASRAARVRSTVVDSQMLFRQADEDARRSVEHSARAGVPWNDAAQRAAFWVIGPTTVQAGREQVERALGDRDLSHIERGYVLTSLAELEAMGGCFDPARENVAHAERLHREFSQTLALTTVWPRAASAIELLAGDPVRAAALLENPQLDPHANAAWFGYLAACRANALVAAGELDEATCAAEVARLHAPADELLTQIMWRHVLARTLAARGNRRDAQRFAEEAVELARPTEAPGVLAESLLALASIDSHPSSSRALVEEAVQLLLDKGNLARVRQVQAQGLG